MSESIHNPDFRSADVLADSLNMDVVCVAEGEEDFSVRPMRECIRRTLEGRGLLPPRPGKGRPADGEPRNPGAQ